MPIEFQYILNEVLNLTLIFPSKSLIAIIIQIGVGTHSSGNHGWALARMAQKMNIPSYIIMPRDAPSSKKRTVLGYNGNIIECGSTIEERENTLANTKRETNCEVIHPYNDYRVISG